MVIRIDDQPALSPPGDVTGLLDAWSTGDASVPAELMDVVQHELRRIARRQFRGERLDPTLQPTAVVYEVYFKLKDQRQVSWRDRVECFGVAAKPEPDDRFDD